MRGTKYGCSPEWPLLDCCCRSLVPGPEAGALLLLLDASPMSGAALALRGGRLSSGQLGTLASLAATVSAETTPAPAAAGSLHDTADKTNTLMNASISLHC